MWASTSAVKVFLSWTTALPTWYKEIERVNSSAEPDLAYTVARERYIKEQHNKKW